MSASGFHTIKSWLVTLCSSGQYGQDIFTLRSSFFQGRPPKSVNMYWRRFPVSSIPLDDSKSFDTWLRERWIEKDALMEQYMQTGRFPALEEGDSSGSQQENSQHESIQSSSSGYIETEVKTVHWWESAQVLVCLIVLVLVLSRILPPKPWNLLLGRTHEVGAT